MLFVLVKLRRIKLDVYRKELIKVDLDKLNPFDAKNKILDKIEEFDIDNVIPKNEQKNSVPKDFEPNNSM